VTELMKLMTKYRTHNHITQNTKHITVLNRNTEWMAMRGFTHNTHYTEHTKTKVTESYRIHKMHTKNHPYAKSQNTHTTQNNRFINAEKKINQNTQNTQTLIFL